MRVRVRVDLVCILELGLYFRVGMRVCVLACGNAPMLQRHVGMRVCVLVCGNVHAGVVGMRVCACGCCGYVLATCFKLSICGLRT